MHTTIGFNYTTAAAFAAQWLNIPAIPDPHKKTEGNFVYIDDWNKIIGFWAVPGTDAEQLRLSSPTIRRVNPYYITKFEAAVLHAGVFELDAFWPNIALPLQLGEGLEMEVYVAAITEELHGFVFLASVVPEPVRGNIHTIRFSCEPARSVHAWSFSEITLIDVLPVGSYDIVGARLESATGLCFRLVPVGGIHRPGGICVKDFTNGALVDNDPDLQRYGGLGVWCSFEHGLVPGIEMVASADAVKEEIFGFLDIIPK